ncbi:MAG: hypothetical protein IT428_27900 [Planctomycetaceae bacterium]|nr:hypothetical protein [Planctomycetaceae bacterium]
MAIRTLCCLALATLWATSPYAEAGPRDASYTVRTRFRIPFRSDPNEMARLGAKEIRLYVSTDKGVRWQQAMTVAPEAGRFEYEAPGEGEYWFAVRTLDSGNRLHPQGQIIDPELKVVVDHTAPELDIQLKQIEPGRVQLSWNASDANLNPRELRLEYVQPGQSDWQPVSILPQASGQTAWSVPRGGVVSVRGTVTDLAGNAGQGQNQIRVEGGVSPVRPGVPDLRQPVAEGAGSVGGEITSRDNPPAIEPNGGSDSLAVQDLFPEGVNSPSNRLPVVARQPRPRNTMVNDDVGSRPDVLSGRYPPAETTTSDMPTAGTKTRVVGGRKFQIGYKVEDVGPSGVSSIELYITEDNGRKWYKYGTDPDHQSPFDVEVPRDGQYGFAIRVRSGAGLAADPPQPGEAPSILVVCDQVGPQIQMLPPQQGRAENLDKVVIRWKVTDENPHDKPVSLSYATDLAGPWQPICGWQANTGSYVWTVGHGVPARIFIRVTARDAAGNLSKADTPEAVVVDLTKPTARIVDIEPTDAGNYPR